MLLIPRLVARPGVKTKTMEYRVWNIRTRQMISDATLMLSPTGTLLQYSLASNMWSPMTDCIIMPYTYFKDRRGNKIYEEDLLKWNYKKDCYIYPVKLTRFGYLPFVYDLKEKTKMFSPSRSEIVGNIYQTKKSGIKSFMFCEN